MDEDGLRRCNWRQGGQEVWLALRRASTVKTFDTYRNQDFGLQSLLRLPASPEESPHAIKGIKVKVLKALVDGAIASFQHFPEADRSRAEEVAEQLAQKLQGGGNRRPTATELLDHLTDPHRTIFPRPPFNKRGRAHLSSYDEPCVMGEVEVIRDPSVSAPTLSGSIFLVEPRNLSDANISIG